ncbi:unnamed protein product [Blepharisma stoltei]|uniref:Maturase K n=1 Tax=Blepharisma stoltei TaxID=1481888 RepID=A0AAU9IKV5_9CILI|nr:unnamed protein product [Blepharisma stoltei]
MNNYCITFWRNPYCGRPWSFIEFLNHLKSYRSNNHKRAKSHNVREILHSPAAKKLIKWILSRFRIILYMANKNAYEFI